MDLRLGKIPKAQSKFEEGCLGRNAPYADAPNLNFFPFGRFFGYTIANEVFNRRKKLDRIIFNWISTQVR